MSHESQKGKETLATKAERITPYDAASPFDARYYLGEPQFFEKIHPYLSEAAQIKYLARVEAAIASTLARVRVCSDDAAKDIREACERITAEEVYAEERRIQHNIRAVVNCIRNRVNPSSRPYVHLFATSADIMDTAKALCLREVTANVLLPDLAALERKLIEIARAHAGTKQIGRTHGRHAVPITFGFAISLYVSRLGQRIQQIRRAADNLRGKYSGAVGAYNALTLQSHADPVFVEGLLMGELGLEPPEISSQITQPEYVCDFVYALVSCWGILANLADDFRHLFRSEIHEIGENAESDPRTEVVGSSTMPHKINPKDFENVKSLWKAYMPRMTTVLMDQISEHQRDLTNSASGRFITELVAAFAYAVFRLSSAIDGIKPDPERMKQILEDGKDPAVAEPLYLLLSLAGHSDAHEKARVLARQSRVEKVPLAQIIQNDPDLRDFLHDLNPKNRAILKDPANYIGAASERTYAICDDWEKRLPTLLDRARSPRA
jgi:adenylosuccinate lyase